MQRFAAIIVGLLSSTTSLSEEVDPFSLSLADLSEIRVTVSSHRPETRLETPAIVTRLNVDEMRALGLSELTDILSFVPGMQVQHHLFGQPFMSVRGIYEGFNQKVLFLLDDTPYFMPSHSDVPLRGIPLDIISHVEIIRGPGAVYYGTNATAGVVKVVTKENVERNQLQLNSSEYQDWRVSGAMEQAINAQSSIVLAGAAESDKRFAVTYPEFDGFAAGSIDQVHHNQSIYARYQSENTRLFFHGFESEYTGLAQPRTVENVNMLTYEGFMLSFSHESKISKDNQLRYFADYTRFDLRFDIENTGGFRMANDGEDNYRFRAGVNWDYVISDTLDWFSGVEWERRSTEDYQAFDTSLQTTGTIMPSFDLDEVSLYGQLDITPYDTGRILAGFRYTDNDIIGNSIVPRLAYVHSLSANSSIKALYSVGFNTPSFTQLKANLTGVVNGNDNLDAEQVASFDLGYYWQDSQINAGITLFHFTADNFVYSDRSTGSIEFFNSGRFEHSGLEMEWEQNAFANTKWFASTSYLFDGNQVDERDDSAKFSPEYSFNIGMNWFNTSHKVGTSLRYVGERASADATLLWNMSYYYTLNHLKAGITLKNVLEDDQYQPNMAEFNDRLVPNGPDNRFTEISLTYRF